MGTGDADPLRLGQGQARLAPVGLDGIHHLIHPRHVLVLDERREPVDALILLRIGLFSPAVVVLPGHGEQPVAHGFRRLVLLVAFVSDREELAIMARCRGRPAAL